MIFNRTRILLFSIFVVIIATFLIISCSNTNNSNANNLKYKKENRAINKSLAINYLLFAQEAIHLHNQIKNGTVTLESGDELIEIKNELGKICKPTDIANGCSKHRQMFIEALSFSKTYLEFQLLYQSFERDKLLLQKNIGSKSTMDNQTRMIEAKKEELKRRLEALLSYFE